MRKNALYLWSFVISGDWLRVLVLAVLVCIVSVTNCQTLAIVHEYNATISQYNYWKLSDNYFYTTALFDKVDVESISSLSSVENAVGVNINEGQGTAFIINQPLTGNAMPEGFLDSPESYVDRVFWVHNLSNNKKDVASIYPVKTIDGETITRLEPNQILLDESAQKYYSKGDIIQLSLDTFQYDETGLSTVNAEIVGFVSKDTRLMESGCRGEIGSLFTPMEDPNNSISYMEIELGIPCNYLITSVFELEEGYLNAEERYAQLLILKKAEDASYGDFKVDLESIGINSVELRYTNNLMNEYKESHMEKIRRALIYEVISIVITLVLIITSFVEWFTHRKHELVIFNICGCSWKECIVLSNVPNVFAMIVGTLLGTVVWNIDSYNAKVSPLFFCLLFVVYCLIYLIISTVYYLIYKDKSSSELYRNKE